MVTINSASQAALTALSLLRPLSISSSSAPQESRALGLNPGEGGRPSFATYDAIMQIGEILHHDRVKSAPQLEYLNTVRADTVVRRQATPISETEFQDLVLQHGMKNWSHLSGFNEAIADGTLKIQRASDAPELGLGSSHYDLYNSGSHIGSVYGGNGTFNKDLFLSIQAQGIRQATGSINGHEYYVTWSDPSLAKN